MPVRDALPQRLVDVLTDIGPMTVAYSGGVDSTLLAIAATTVLGAEHTLSVTAVSPSLAADDFDRCARLAADHDLNWRTVDTDEMADDRYQANDTDRCYWCKTHLMEALLPVAVGTVVLGVNVDDLGDHRPGQRAAREHGARFPFVEAGMTKDDVRDVSRTLGLSTADQPASPCLSSRLPYGTPVTLGRLSQVELAERALRRLGFDEVRVRHHDRLGLVEVPAARIAQAADLHDRITEAVRGAGFDFVALDLEGFHSGKLNRGLSATGSGVEGNGDRPTGSGVEGNGEERAVSEGHPTRTTTRG
ncbi:MAG: ATP-dependent sacrificial sulfur transferase LarE [Ilumatobacter sp.]|nr:ATP-dependent sacrificial sulfur transferase LarE [Ilumatobacter sp.]